MNLDDISTRRQYIRVSNELNKKNNTEIYVKGNKEKVELDKKLDELSIKTGVLVSGNIVRQNILNQSASRLTMVPNFIDTYVALEEEDKKFDKARDKYYANNINRGKEIVETMKKSKKNELDKINIDKK